MHKGQSIYHVERRNGIYVPEHMYNVPILKDTSFDCLKRVRSLSSIQKLLLRETIKYSLCAQNTTQGIIQSVKQVVLHTLPFHRVSF